MGARPKPAVFLDRDGTITQLRGFITSPNQIELIPDAAMIIERMRSSGLLCVLITNQSAIGRGMITKSELEEIHAELEEQLAFHNTTLDAIYWCPDAPNSEETVIDSPRRKPGPGMLLDASRDLNIDLSQSWMIGDRISDVLAGMNAGCKGSIRVRTGYQYPKGVPEVTGRYSTVNSLSEAVDLILT